MAEIDYIAMIDELLKIETESTMFSEKYIDQLKRRKKIYLRGYDKGVRDVCNQNYGEQEMKYDKERMLDFEDKSKYEEEITEERRERILKLRYEIGDTDLFLWSKTKEGYDYWREVYDALWRIAHQEPIKKEIEVNGRKYRLVEE